MRKVDLFLLLKSRRSQNLSKKGAWIRFFRSLGLLLISVISLLLTGVILFTAVLYTQVTRDLPSLEELPVLLDTEKGELLQPTRMTDRSGKVTLYVYENPGIPRKFLSINPDEESHISLQLIRTVIADLEPDFWKSPGYSRKNWRDAEPLTITERLVNDLLLWQEPPSNIRPLRMRLLAGQLVARYGRAQVLEWFLNSVWFGQYAYGAESASHLYLQKSAQELTLSDAALLTTLIKSPALNPIDAPQTSIKMQQDFLEELLKNGVIREEEYKIARVQELDIPLSFPQPGSDTAGFVVQVEKQLKNLIGLDRVWRGGLSIRTTMDSDLQEQLFCTSISQLIRLESNNISGVAGSDLNCPAALLLPTQNFQNLRVEGLVSAGLVMDPGTGEVLAYQEPVALTGITFPDGGYKPGTMISPIVVLTAFARGYSPASLVWDIPSAAVDLPQDYLFRGAINLRSTLANDAVVPITNLAQQFGMENISKLGSTIGITSINSAGREVLGLFTEEYASLLELGMSYSTLANSGTRAGVIDPLSKEIVPNTIREVKTPTGREILERDEPSRFVALSSSLSYLINHILSDEVARWSSLGYPNELEIGSPIAARVGKSMDGSQVWTVGYSPERLVLVWVGTQPGVVNLSQLDPRMAAGIWHSLLRYSTVDSVFSGWVTPAEITTMKVCNPSGMLPTADCPSVVDEVFLMGNEPTLPDTLYMRIKVNRETGQRATVFTPADLVEERVFMDIPPDAQDWALSTGISLAPQGYDAISSNFPDSDAMIVVPEVFSSVAGKVNIRGNASGDSFASYNIQVGEGINPESWLQVGGSTKPVENGSLAQWDTAGLNGLYAVKLSVIDSNNMIKTAISQVTVDNAPPVVRITYPPSGESVETVRGGVTITASVEDLVGINRVDWWLDGKLVSTQTLSPYVYHFTGSLGTHEVQVRAWDLAGNQVKSPLVTFKIER